jgi:hypothetical protein
VEFRFESKFLNPRGGLKLWKECLSLACIVGLRTEATFLDQRLVGGENSVC